MLSTSKKEQIRSRAADLIEVNVLGSEEVQEILMVNRSRLSAIVKAGKLDPIKELKRESLFWLPDVLNLRNEMKKDTRTNLYKKLEVLEDENQTIQ
jgi:hypothetical protein